MYVMFVAAVSIASCVAAIITQFTHCLPLRHNWQILPDPGSEYYFT
jgi:archaellum component FlaG (FlaF/FlaG flagellin family)